MQDEYISCPWIEGGLSFLKNKLHHCCMPNVSSWMKNKPVIKVSERKGWPFICSYEGGTLPVEEILKSRQSLVEKLNNGEDSPCSDCIFLQKKRWPRSGQILNYAIVFSPYTLCNLRCSYCTMATSGDCRMYFPLLPVIQQLVKYTSKETTSFGWAGGEPTMVKELGDGFSLLSESVKQVTFSTNSTMFSDVIYRSLGQKKNAETFIKSSIDAGTPEKYRQIRGKDFFYRAFDNLQKYAAKSPGTVFAKYIVLTENCDLREIRFFIDQIAIRNIKRVIISSDYSRWTIPAEHWAALETLFTGLKSHGVDVVFTHHLMSLIYSTDVKEVPNVLHSGYMDTDCPTCWPREKRDTGAAAVKVSDSGCGNRTIL